MREEENKNSVNMIISMAVTKEMLAPVFHCKLISQFSFEVFHYLNMFQNNLPFYLVNMYVFETLLLVNIPLNKDCVRQISCLFIHSDLL